MHNQIKKITIELQENHPQGRWAVSVLKEFEERYGGGTQTFTEYAYQIHRAVDLAKEMVTVSPGRRTDLVGEAGDTLPEQCGLCHAKQGDECQCPPQDHCACGGTGAVPAHPTSSEEYDACPDCTKRFPHKIITMKNGEPTTECEYCGMYYPEGACPALSHPNRKQKQISSGFISDNAWSQ